MFSWSVYWYKESRAVISGWNTGQEVSVPCPEREKGFYLWLTPCEYDYGNSEALLQECQIWNIGKRKKRKRLFPVSGVQSPRLDSEDSIHTGLLEGILFIEGKYIFSYTNITEAGMIVVTLEQKYSH